MRNCKSCVFCKKDALSDYLQDVTIYKCDMDNDIIFVPVKEGTDCAWFKAIPKKQDGIIKKLRRWFRRRRTGRENIHGERPKWE